MHSPRCVHRLCLRVPVGDVYFWMAPVAPVAARDTTDQGGRLPSHGTAQIQATRHTRTLQRSDRRNIRRYGGVTQEDWKSLIATPEAGKDHKTKRLWIHREEPWGFHVNEETDSDSLSQLCSLWRSNRLCPRRRAKGKAGMEGRGAWGEVARFISHHRPAPTAWTGKRWRVESKGERIIHKNIARKEIQMAKDQEARVQLLNMFSYGYSIGAWTSKEDLRRTW